VKAEVGEKKKKKRLDELKAGMRLETQCGKHSGSGVKRFAERGTSRGLRRRVYDDDDVQYIRQALPWYLYIPVMYLYAGAPAHLFWPPLCPVGAVSGAYPWSVARAGVSCIKPVLGK
jgi:hypothetical protein